MDLRAPVRVLLGVDHRGGVVCHRWRDDQQLREEAAMKLDLDAIEVATVRRPGYGDNDADLIFIAAARSDVPALVKRVRELEAALLRLADAWDRLGPPA